jgi:monodictyphenone polyketide synthase
VKRPPSLRPFVEQCGNMDVIYFSNEFPKEDLQDVFRQLHVKSKDHCHPLLAQFMLEATKAIKHEITELPSRTKQLIPPFATLDSWAENQELREGPLCGAIDGVLLILAQISLYIR